MNRTRFISTLGPSCFNRKSVSEMVKFGSVSFRLNTAHIEPGYVTKTKKLLSGTTIDGKLKPSIIVDLKGPEIRAKFSPGEILSIVKNKTYKIGDDGPADIILNPGEVVSQLDEGDIVLLSDGRVKMKVTGRNGERLMVKALNSGKIRNNARVNIPDKELNLGMITERDEVFLKEGIKEKVEFFALSFVQSVKNVEEFREKVEEYGGNQFVISKIETRTGLRNADGICRASDMIMVARGDLGVELPWQEISIVQKGLIHKAHSYGIPSIVATQILESMVENEVPTRAEINDISNAILDGADILMLSEETAVGKHPLQAVRVLNSVTKYVESKLSDYPEPEEFQGNRIAYAVAKSAKILSSDIRKDIVALTRSGSTVKMLSALRPFGKIYVLSDNADLLRKLYLYNNAYPLDLKIKGKCIEEITDEIIGSGIFPKGTMLVLTSGEPYFPFGGTNDVRCIVVGDFIGRGFATGPFCAGKATYGRDKKGDIFISSKPDDSIPQQSKGVLFTYRPPLYKVDSLVRDGKTVVSSVIFRRSPNEGEFLNIDPHTGIIYA
ncbi:MAG: pyruvate kinase [Thermoplasmatales archaeon]